MTDDLYLELKCLMLRKSVSLGALEKKIGITHSVMGSRIDGKYAFTLDEVYDICAELDIPLDKINFYFPPRTPEMRSYTKGVKGIKLNRKFRKSAVDTEN